jgi:Tol biopolymer transport system component
LDIMAERYPCSLIAPDVSRGRGGLAWLPDGRAITYTTTHDETVDADGSVSGTTRLWRLDLAIGEKRLLAEESGDRMLGNVEVSPAGDRLVYLDGLHLKVVDVRTGAQTEVPKSFSGRRGAWSPDGARLAFTRFAPNDEFGRRGDNILADRGLWVWRLADGHLTKLLPFPDGDGRMWGPYWSPDGEWLAFVWETEERTEQQDRFASPSETKIIHPDGSGLRSLAALRSSAFLLGDQCWSPDSRALVFAWHEALGEAKWEWSAAAKHWVPPDGVYVDRGVVILDISTGEIAPLVPPNALGPERRVQSSPAWSPQGSAIALTISKPPLFSSSVYVAASRDGTLLPIAEGTRKVRYGVPVWSPDGESLLYLKNLRGPDGRDLRAELWLTKIGEAE